ncbi:low molecular weight phosphatase family protein [Halohasta salina]|uniref:arsenate-mycothiol transferase ArsC n=1 Tax=Halohasta salina TaxID=2961621 RepID=UPI0020A33612|nr:arsenate reductase ArsC [Halohasta salina]
MSTTIAFVCVQNAGRSQMATAFAEQARTELDAEDEIEIETGGTQPADHVHPEVVDVMQEMGIDLSERTPKEVTPDDLRAMDLVVTMGCSAEGVCPAAWNGENRDWDLDDPDGQDLDSVRAIRDDIERRVEALFEELVATQ